MSELLNLAKTLRSMTDQQLEHLIRNSQVGTPEDFIDLANQLLSAKSIEHSLACLTRDEIRHLKDLPAKLEPNDPLLATGLVICIGSSCELVSDAKIRLQNSAPQELEDEVQNIPVEFDLNLAGFSAFETQQAITELLLDFEYRVVRVVSRANLSSADLKAIASLLHKPAEFIKNVFKDSVQLGLIGAFDSRWWLQPLARVWLDAEPLERWLMLAENWMQRLGSRAVAELAIGLKERSNLRDSLREIFPLAHLELNQRLDELCLSAERLGLTIEGNSTPLLEEALNEGLIIASRAMADVLPKTQNKFVAQGDQTMIALGPLPTPLEITVRKFADVEQISIASSYRVSETSITRGLEFGLSETEIRELLDTLTNSSVPQPVDYVISNAAKRFGRIQISGGDGMTRSLIKTSDTALLSEILNDVRLRPFALHPISAATLASRFEPEVLYFGLREHGFLAILLDEQGAVAKPKLPISWREPHSVETKNYAAELVANLRSTEARLGSKPSDDDLLRQLQLAIKGKATVRVSLKLRDESIATYEIRVSSLANGRLRGLDFKADIERVLPVSQITRVEF